LKFDAVARPVKLFEVGQHLIPTRQLAIIAGTETEDLLGRRNSSYRAGRAQSLAANFEWGNELSQEEKGKKKRRAIVVALNVLPSAKVTGSLDE